MTNNRVIYPALTLRVRAAMWDGLLYGIMLYLLSLPIGLLPEQQTALRAALVVGPVALFEPLMLALTGGTLGHHFFGIKVVRADGEGNLPLLRAFLRFCVRFIVGIPSLLFMLATRRRQAAHDVIVESLVLFKDPSRAKPHDIASEIAFGDPPSALRKLAVFALYVFPVLFVFSSAFGILVSPGCLQRNLCSDGETLAIIFTAMAFSLIMFALAVLALRAKLPGLRPREDST